MGETLLNVLMRRDGVSEKILELVEFIRAKAKRKQVP